MSRGGHVASRAATLVAALLLALAAHAADDRFAGAAAAYRVERDGIVVFAANERAPLPPASLTKMLTALVVAEALPEAHVVTVSPRAARAAGARLGLSTGMRITVGELLTAMLLRSANDACLALAEAVDGDERAFVARLNRRSAELGLADTRFANACGFDAPGHRSSAVDLARLAKRLLAIPPLARRVALARATVRTLDGRRFEVDTTNALIGRVDGALGVKTGYTRRAGRCLVGLVERRGVRVLVVMLGAGDRWWDAVAMIEQAFESAPGR